MKWGRKIGGSSSFSDNDRGIIVEKEGPVDDFNVKGKLEVATQGYKR